VLLANGTGVQQAHVAVGAGGVAAAVWMADGAGSKAVFASRYTPPYLLTPGFWNPPVQLGVAGANTDRIRVAVDEKGNILAAWGGVGAFGNERILAAHYSATLQTWRVAAIPGTAALRRQVVVALAGGRGVVAFTQITGLYDDPHIHASILVDPPTTWTAPQQLTTRQSDSPTVVMDTSQRIGVAWQQASGTIPSLPTYIFGSIYRPATGWTAPQQLDMVPALPVGVRAMAPDLAAAPNGIGMLAWLQKGNLSGDSVHARRLDLATGWAPTGIVVESGSLLEPFASEVKVTADGSKNSAVVFSRKASGVNFSVYARVINAVGQLVPNPPLPPTGLETRLEVTQRLWAGMASSGRGFGGWLQSNGTSPSAFASFLEHTPPGPGCVEWTFGAAAELDTVAATVQEATGAMGANGAAALVWISDGAAGTRNVYVRSYN
jgi:hypothetical protein